MTKPSDPFCVIYMATSTTARILEIGNILLLIFKLNVYFMESELKDRNLIVATMKICYILVYNIFFIYVQGWGDMMIWMKSGFKGKR